MGKERMERAREGKGERRGREWQGGVPQKYFTSTHATQRNAQP